MQPYQMVKDLRSPHHRRRQGVLDGELDPFIKAFLMGKASGTLGQPTPDEDE